MTLLKKVVLTGMTALMLASCAAPGHIGKPQGYYADSHKQTKIRTPKVKKDRPTAKEKRPYQKAIGISLGTGYYMYNTHETYTARPSYSIAQPPHLNTVLDGNLQNALKTKFSLPLVVDAKILLADKVLLYGSSTLPWKRKPTPLGSATILKQLGSGNSLENQRYSEVTTVTDNHQITLYPQAGIGFRMNFSHRVNMDFAVLGSYLIEQFYTREARGDNIHTVGTDSESFHDYASGLTPLDQLDLYSKETYLKHGAGFHVGLNTGLIGFGFNYVYFVEPSLKNILSPDNPSTLMSFHLRFNLDKFDERKRNTYYKRLKK